MEAETAEPSRVGEVLGEKYRLLRVIGEGGMGAVYEAENEWTKRRVALKLLRPEFTRNKEAVRRFRQEAQTATQIAHPNIVDVLDMGQDARDGAMYIVQEFLIGLDLRQRLERDRRIEPREALDLLVPIMGALVAAHKRGVVHRDIKPENIFLSKGRNGTIVPKLIDFGISKVTADANESSGKTRAGTAMGTPEYMSPEQARGDTSIDERTDVWSVGVVLFEMLCGRPPFEAPTYNLLVAKVMFEPPPRIETFATDVPPDLAAIVHRALQPDRDARLPSMRAFLSALLECPLASTSRGEDGLAQRHKDSLPVGDDDTAALPEPASVPRVSVPAEAPRVSTPPAEAPRVSTPPAEPRLLAADVPALDLGITDRARPPRELLPAPMITPPEVDPLESLAPAPHSTSRAWALRLAAVVAAGLGAFGLVRLVASGSSEPSPPGAMASGPVRDHVPSTPPPTTLLDAGATWLPGASAANGADSRGNDRVVSASHASHGSHGGTSSNAAPALAEPARVDAVPDAGSVNPNGPHSVDALLAGVSGHGGAETALPDQPSPSLVSATLRGLSSAVRACAQGQTGVAHVRLVIRGDGSVERASVSGAFGADAHGCIQDVVRSARFPRFRAPVFSLDYPYAVTARSD